LTRGGRGGVGRGGGGEEEEDKEEGGEEEEEGGGGDDNSDDDLVVTDCSQNFYTVCAASLASYCNGMWVTGSWV
jgi:hypothetical protein